MWQKSSSAGRSCFGRRRNAICVAEMLELRMLLSTVTVNASTTIRTVPSDMVGVNTAPWDPMSTSQTLSLSQAAGLNTVRIGGGSTADRIHFNSTSYYLSPTSSSSGETASSNSMFGQAALYAASLGASAIVTVDYGEGSPQEAAALLSYLDGSTTNTTSLGSGEEWSVTAQSVGDGELADRGVLGEPAGSGSLGS